MVKMGNDHPQKRFYSWYYNWIDKKIKSKILKIFFEILPFFLILIIIIGGILISPIINEWRLYYIDKNMIKSGEFIIESLPPHYDWNKSSILYEYIVDSNLKIDKVSIINELVINNLPDNCISDNFNENDVIKKDYYQTYKFSISCNDTLIPENISIKLNFMCLYKKLKWDNLTLCKEVNII